MSAGESRRLHAPVAWAWGMWSLAAAFYLLAFYHRVAPAVLTGELMREFSIGAAMLGNLSAVYFYCYVLMQIPAGVLLDRYGTRRVLSVAALITAFGTAVFALSESIYGASIGRGLIGAAVGVSFVGVIALSARWFEPNRVSFATGVALFVGILGGIFGGAPLRWLVDNFGWRAVMSASAGVALAIAAAIAYLMRDNPSEKGFRDFQDHAGAAPTRGAWASALRRPVLWAVFVAQGGITNTTLTFAGLWGVPFLASHYAMTTAQAALIASASLLAMAVGGPALALASEWLRSNRAVCILACTIGLIAWGTIVMTPALPRPALVALLLITGFCSGALVLGIALAREFVSPQLAGTATGIANMGAVLGPTLMQPLAGVVLDLKWDGATSEGVRIYSFAAYQAAFALMAAWVAIGLVIFALLPRRPRAWSGGSRPKKAEGFPLSERLMTAAKSHFVLVLRTWLSRSGSATTAATDPSLSRAGRGHRARPGGPATARPRRAEGRLCGRRRLPWLRCVFRA